jgi:hypothetical protein
MHQMRRVEHAPARHLLAADIGLDVQPVKACGSRGTSIV